ncbi:hypothetical protein [Marinobacterium sp. BA1]|uniref:hypothetical protein n=1 Tax=Marinobacterium sp. BA1 TaxID=3138931 RepID=UPI0034E897B8
MDELRDIVADFPHSSVACVARKAASELERLQQLVLKLEEDVCKQKQLGYVHAGVLCGHPQAEGRVTVNETADCYFHDCLRSTRETVSHQNDLADAAKAIDTTMVMSDAKLFQLMNVHPNPVTRAVYRDMWINRQA